MSGAERRVPLHCVNFGGTGNILIYTVRGNRSRETWNESPVIGSGSHPIDLSLSQMPLSRIVHAYKHWVTSGKSDGLSPVLCQTINLAKASAGLYCNCTIFVLPQRRPSQQWYIISSLHYIENTPFSYKCLAWNETSLDLDLDLYLYLPCIVSCFRGYAIIYLLSHLRVNIQIIYCIETAHISEAEIYTRYYNKTHVQDVFDTDPHEVSCHFATHEAVSGTSVSKKPFKMSFCFYPTIKK